MKKKPGDTKKAILRVQEENGRCNEWEKAYMGCRESQINGTETRAKKIKKNLRETMRDHLVGPALD